MSYVVNLFQSERGDFPVKEFIRKQDKKLKTKIFHYIWLLIHYGPFLKPPFSKKLFPKLYELRIPGKAAARILYTIINNEYYLLHAFMKKTQKTPKKEIQKALDRIKEII